MYKYLLDVISNKMKSYMIKNNYSSEEIDKATYGIKVTIVMILDTIITFSLAYLLGILDKFIIGYIVIAIVRSIIGGIHLKEYYQCITMSFLLMSLTGILPKYIPNNIYVYIINIISSAIILLYAPADTKQKPLYSSKKKRLLKDISIMLVLTTSVGLTVSSYEIFKAFSCGIFLSSLLITPTAYRIFKVQRG